MLPAIFDDLNEELDLDQDDAYETEPSLTYRLNNDGTVSGMVDGQAAVLQAVSKIFRTERYECQTCSWDYGIELKDLYGMPMDFVMPELKRRIQEALEMDDRITGVDSFVFQINEKKVAVQCTVHSVFGDVQVDEEVDAGV